MHLRGSFTKNGDIDLDFSDREQALSVLPHIDAHIIREGTTIKHASGAYVNDIPYDEAAGWSSFDYKTAEEIGYIKIDFLNNGIYKLVNSREHLDRLAGTEPPWERLADQEFFKHLVHIGNHYQAYQRLKEPIDSIPRMAMFLALIRPAKKYLLGRSWQEIEKNIWLKELGHDYSFKQSHSFAYSLLVAIHMNLLNENSALLDVNF